MVSCAEPDISYDVNFTCRQCAACCRNRRVFIDARERRAIEGFDWASVSPRLAAQQLFVEAGSGESGRCLTLARRDGVCVFLEDDGRCLIWRELGHEALPFSCRQFPLVFAEEPACTVVSANFACASVAEGTGSPLRTHEPVARALHAEAIQRATDEKAGVGPLFRVPERIILCAEIGLDWYSYLALERLLGELLEDGSRPLHERLQGMYNLIDAATIIYGNGSKTAPHFKLWIEKMAEKPLRQGLFEGGPRRGRGNALRQRAGLAPLILSMERWQAAEHGLRGNTVKGPGLIPLLRQQGRVYLYSLERELDLRSMRRVTFDQDASETAGLLAKFLGECIRRKLLMRRPNLVAGARFLLSCFALVRWYSVASAASRGSSSVEAHDLHRAIGLVERGYSCDGLADRGAAGVGGQVLTGLLPGLVAPADLVTNFCGGNTSRQGQ